MFPYGGSDAFAPSLPLRELLDLPEMVAAGAEVLTEAGPLDRPVRWVQAIERIEDVSELDGGELLIAADSGLPASDRELAGFAQAVGHAGAAGLVLETGRPLTGLPSALVTACEEQRLPLITVKPAGSVIRLAKSVQLAMVQSRFRALQVSDQAHQTFTRMCAEGVSAGDIVTELSRICGCSAVFENMVHQVLAYAPSGVAAEQLLNGWEARSRDAGTGFGPSDGGAEGEWLTAWVEARGNTYGRLILLPAEVATASHRIVLQRAASALALNRLIEQNKSSLERQAHRSTLVYIIEHRFRSLPEMHARTAAQGVPTSGRAMIAVVIDVVAMPHPVPGGRSSTAETVAATLAGIGVPALVADLRRGRIGALLSLLPTDDRKATLTRFVRELKVRGQMRADDGLIVAAGSTVQDLEQVARSFSEAHQVADAAEGANTGKPYYELPDIQLRGLLHLLGDDPRLQSFIERTLGALMDFDRRNQAYLLDTLRTFLLHGGNKSAAAEAAHVARQTFYRRLNTVHRVLKMDLDSVEVRTSLHAAMMALESQRSARKQDQLGGRVISEGGGFGLNGPERANAESAW